MNDAVYVQNEYVKMKWEKRMWLQTEGLLDEEPELVLAGHEYDTSNGKVTVFFRPFFAFLQIEDDEIFSFDSLNTFEDVVDLIKYHGYEPSEPEACAGFNKIIDAGMSVETADMELVEMYGLKEHLPDIVERLSDLGHWVDVGWCCCDGERYYEEDVDWEDEA